MLLLIHDYFPFSNARLSEVEFREVIRRGKPSLNQNTKRKVAEFASSDDDDESRAEKDFDQL